ncbi:serine/threonine protein kinase [Streptomyces sp. NPDC001480]|uniref:serine/threonine protein kinase n=1 Tax=Streptomyces sp. NPDC001480 TaxID=3364577 RepID=UPI0036C27B10
MTMVKAHVSAQELVAGRYRLLDVVGRETNRICWYAEDLEAERPRLVTQIALPTGSPEEAPRRTCARILRTSEVMSVLRPGRVPMVIDAVEESGTLWTVTDVIGGRPLGEVLSQEGAFNYVRAARIGLELLDVLEAAHDEGFTHGELSPDQVFVRDRGPVVVTGFGLAGATLAPRVTAPAYASPEQARDERIGPAADLWALGAILYTMVEGRPPFRDRGRFEATLKGVDRLPLRTPLRAGPLSQVVQGLLRKDSRERLTRPVAREALTRVLNEDLDADRQTAPVPRLRAAYAAALRPGGAWSRRTMVAGTALAVVTVAVAVLAATHGLPGTGTDTDSAASGGSRRPSASAPASTPAPSPSPSPSPSGSDRTDNKQTHSPSPSAARTSGSPTAPSPSRSTTALPDGYHRYTAPEGFSVALPDGWKRLETARDSDAYRVTFGTADGSTTLAVTYSEGARVKPDPVVIWRDDVEPDLEKLAGYRRIGEIRATTYQGHKAADMEWVSGTGDDAVHTFGRGFLVGDQQGFSLRFTTPAADWESAADREAQSTFLRTFRPPAA